MGAGSAVDGDATAAIGLGAEAKGSSSLAMGHTVVVSSDDSVAIGKDLVIREEADRSVVVGRGIVAGARGSVQIGYDDRSVEEQLRGLGASETEINQYTTSGLLPAAITGRDGIELGTRSDTAGDYSLTGGYEAVSTRAAVHGIALGTRSNVSAHSGIAIGAESRVSASHGIAIGRKANSSGIRSVALGAEANARDVARLFWVTKPAPLPMQATPSPWGHALIPANAWHQHRHRKQGRGDSLPFRSRMQ